MMEMSTAPVLGVQSADHDHCLHLPGAHSHWLCSHSGMTHLLPHPFPVCAARVSLGTLGKVVQRVPGPRRLFILGEETLEKKIHNRMFSHKESIVLYKANIQHVSQTGDQWEK